MDNNYYQDARRPNNWQVIFDVGIQYVYIYILPSQQNYCTANKSVDLSFETQIGGPNDTLHGIFVSGAGTQDLSVNGWGY